IGQLGVAVVMLVVSTLFVSGLRGLFQLQNVHDPRHVLVLSVSLPQARYPNASARERFYTAALDRLSSMPGVQASALCSTVPLSNNGTTWERVAIENQPIVPRLPASVVSQSVSA